MKSDACTYVTLLYDDTYLPGVIALHQSLKKVRSETGLMVLVAGERVNARTTDTLTALAIAFRQVKALRSPYADTPAVYKETFTKLRILELTEYRKIVYLDADTLVLHNIDELFGKEAWSAVNAGGMLPEHAGWVQLNSGVLVLEPDPSLADDMLRAQHRLPSTKGRGDQGFLQRYFPDWPSRSDLHLDHRYNLYAGHLDRYHELFGYDLTDEKTDRSVCLVHYWGPRKPWYAKAPGPSKGPLHTRAFQRWWQVFEEAEYVNSSYGVASVG
ncbi:MAG: hypothetical protein AVDCRST_MAG56-4215 [uncultured Cytophagales bacterium]|uniref:Glycosyltransferase family 8 protein n=1 Tax=uncultured Cytophagales bacterium TaxID=158755 RepID=A0A6J4JRW2_9SPHI|nr:MAG: hypothetical protein AVDCRST_MAG56-4215 [uncultured Cytophagales bacterium]